MVETLSEISGDHLPTTGKNLIIELTFENNTTIPFSNNIESNNDNTMSSNSGQKDPIQSIIPQLALYGQYLEKQSQNSNSGRNKP